MIKIIAEFCQNHNGDYRVLQEMIHQAAEGGATYGKIQTIFAEDLNYRERFENGVTENGKLISIKRPYQAEYDRLKGLELSYEDQLRFISDCKKYGLIPMTTCFTRGSVVRIAELPWDTVKVASYDCASYPLLTELARKFSKMIVSTGSTYDHEVTQSARILSSSGVDFTLLHCVTIYPTPLSYIHLRRIEFLKNFSKEVGFSGHTLTKRDGIKADLAAIYLGADVIERHFTILKETETKDGPVSLNQTHLKQICKFSRLSRADQKAYLDEHVPEFSTMLGLKTRELSDAELLNRDYYRGRFATHIGSRTICNWDEDELK